MTTTALRSMTVVETRLLVREPVACFFAVFFPALLLVVLGSFMPGFTEPDPEYAGARPVDVYAPVAIALAIATVALVTLSATVAAYREKGVLKRLATTPVGPYRVVVANLVVQGAALVLASALTVAVARVVFDVALPRHVPGFLLALGLGTASMCALGLLVAAAAPNARAASGIGTLVYFPSMFFGGVWTPGPTMPEGVQRVADLTPLGAASAAMQDAWAGSPPSTHLVVMAVWAVGCTALAARTFRWQ